MNKDKTVKKTTTVYEKEIAWDKITRELEDTESAFPGFGKVFAEVNKAWSKDKEDASINQQCYLAYTYLKKWYDNAVNKDTNELKFTEEQWISIKNMFYDGLIRKDNYEMSDNAWEFIEKEAIRKGYIAPTKEEPLIVHNVMSYKGKNYLKHPRIKHDGSCFDCAIESMRSSVCQSLNDCSVYKDYIWKSFDDIKLTDGLACMRKDIGDIYIKGALEHVLILKGIELVDGILKALIYIPENSNDNRLQFTSIGHLRLATAEELQEYFDKEK